MTTPAPTDASPLNNRQEPAPIKADTAEALLSRFPPRPVLRTWQITTLGAEEIIARIDRPPLQAPTVSTQAARRYGARKLLLWLSSFPGETWQERWDASGAARLGQQWIQEPMAWLPQVGYQPTRGGLRGGFLALLLADAVRPDLRFLVEMTHSRFWRHAVAVHRDPAGFAELEASVDPDRWSSRTGHVARGQISMLVLAKGAGVHDITVGDCLELRMVEATVSKTASASRSLFYSMLHGLGTFPPGAPANLQWISRYTGQMTPGQLVDRYGVHDSSIRDVLVDYLAERQPRMDYTSLEDLSRSLALHFWKNLEDHHPGISSFHLPRPVAAAWKQRLQTKTVRRRQPDGTMREITSKRESYITLLTQVRAFYLDLAEWAMEDPARWGPWAAPCPIRSSEISFKKSVSRRKARMDQRTRDRLPVLQILVKTAEQRLRDARARLDAVTNTPAGQTFTVNGESFAKASSREKRDRDSSHIAYKTATKQRVNLAQAENRAFWAWAAIEFLRHTGVRIEEMLETSHHSITQYRLPSSGELVPLLQIAPSKTDQERLLVVSPELADALSAIVQRVRDADGVIPLIPFYDKLEKVWNPATPLLFQWTTGGQHRQVSDALIRRAINEVLQTSGLTDSTGQPLAYQPHDFRRIFTTEALQNGMPPHIAQLLLGHQDINTTMGYKAVYPEEAISGHRAFIARRRGLRPSEEYRVPTDEEWQEFLGHFERRKVALGECGRAYGTSCQHEHSCVRCPLLRVDPAERARLEEIRDNLTDRIAEAEREGWLGEAEGLQVSHAAAEGKLAQLDERARRARTINLGIPTFSEVAGRTAALPEKQER